MKILEDPDEDPTNKFIAEISCTDVTFSDTTIYKVQRFNKELVLNMRTHQQRHPSTHSIQQFTHWEKGKALPKSKL